MIAAAIPARMTATAYGVAFVVSPVFGILLLVPLLLEVLDGVELPGVAFVVFGTSTVTLASPPLIPSPFTSALLVNVYPSAPFRTFAS